MAQRTDPDAAVTQNRDRLAARAEARAARACGVYSNVHHQSGIRRMIAGFVQVELARPKTSTPA
jgi:hypothetical protein